MKRLLFALLLLLPSTALAQAGRTRCVTASPTVDTGGAYATGELIGGELTFSNLLRGNVGTGYIVSVTIADKAAQAVDLDVVISRSTLSGTTFTDQAAFDPADADLSKIIGVVNFGSSSRFAFSDNALKYVGSLALPVQSPAASSPSANVYGAIVARGAYTGASASDLAVTICASQD